MLPEYIDVEYCNQQQTFSTEFLLKHIDDPDLRCRAYNILANARVIDLIRDPNEDIQDVGRRVQCVFNHGYQPEFLNRKTTFEEVE